MNKKIIILATLVSIIGVGAVTANAGTKTKSFSHGSTTAKGYLKTDWSAFSPDQGKAMTSRGAGSLEVGAYIESQNVPNGPRTDYSTVTGTDVYTKNITRDGVWRYNSSHYIQQGGSNVQIAYQTDW
ncbi:MAG: hypothetical protein ACRC6T_07630 [Sarcina sp.]